MKNIIQVPLLKVARFPMLSFSGLFGTLIFITLIEILIVNFRTFIPDPAFILLLPIVYSGFTGGIWVGLGSATISLIYLVYFFSPPGQILNLDLHDWLEVSLQAFVYPLLVVLISFLRRKNLEQAKNLRAEVERRKHSESELLLQNNYLNTLHGTTIALLEEANLSELLETIIKEACGIANTPNGGIFLVDHEQDKMVLTIGLGSFASHVGQGLPRGVGVTGMIWEQGKTLLIEDYDTWEGKIIQYRQQFQIVHGIIGIPLKVGAEVVGLFELIFDQMERVFSNSELETLEQLAKLASLTIQDLKLKASLQTELVARQKAEAELKVSEERFRYALDASGIGAWSFDLQTEEFIWSYGVDNLHDFSPARQTRNIDQFLEHIWLEDQDVILKLIEQVLAEKTDFCVEYRVVWQNGNVRWIQCKGRPFDYTLGEQPALIYGIVQDITEQKVMLERIKESESRFQAFMEHSPVISWIADQNANLVYISKPELSEQLEGKVIEQIYPPEVINQYLEAVQQVYRENRRVEIVQKIKRVDDSWGVGLSYMFPIHYPSWQRLIGGVTLDITEVQRLKDALEVSQRQFLEAQKLESVGQLAGGIAHDFNNILTAMLSYIKAISSSVGDNKKALLEVGELEVTTYRAVRLVRQLLAFSRRQILELKVVNLNHVINDIMGMLKQLIDKKISFETHLASDLNLIKADASQLEQVILNLVINARDALPKGGNIVIETANAYITSNRFPNLEAGDYVQLSVRDGGVGMNEATLSRIFEPFYSTKTADKGTGLGLAAVFGIVTQSNGYINVVSTVGTGTEFQIYLPKTEEPLTLESNFSIQPVAVVNGVKTILLVEDDDSLRRPISRWLNGNGFRVLNAADGEEALTICEANIADITLVISDLNLPKLGGVTFYQLLKHRYPQLKLLGTSGYSGDFVSKQGILKYCDSFIEKPFDIDNLLSKITTLLSAN
jgi:two-component system, cell cycle sensor histidine kinase and response regulator CckA